RGQRAAPFCLARSFVAGDKSWYIFFNWAFSCSVNCSGVVNALSMVDSDLNSASIPRDRSAAAAPAIAATTIIPTINFLFFLNALASLRMLMAALPEVRKQATIPVVCRLSRAVSTKLRWSGGGADTGRAAISLSGPPRDNGYQRTDFRAPSKASVPYFPYRMF